MLHYLFDTDHLTLFDQGHAQVLTRFAREPPHTVGVSAVTVEEYLRGRLSILSQARKGPQRIRLYGHFIASVRLLQSWDIVAFEQSVEDQFQLLVSQKIRIGTQDLKIAATALANSLILVTRNLRDFVKVPGLTIEDWAV